MIRIKHVGIYVNDLIKMTSFYKNVFKLHEVCAEVEDRGRYLEHLAGKKNVVVRITKLITEAGQHARFGDMVELIKMEGNEQANSSINGITDCGAMHIAFGVDDIHFFEKEIIEHGGKIIVEPFQRSNGNWLCFARDPEGNWLEVIQNAG